MDKILAVEISSPEGIILRDTASEVVVPTDQGETVILPLHTPIYIQLSEGEVIVKSEKQETSIAITGGFLEVENNKVTILSDYAIKSEKIERMRAEEAKMRAEEAMRNRAENENMYEAEKDMRRALLELKVADKIRKKQKTM